jgi:hypothetical protein
MVPLWLALTVVIMTVNLRISFASAVCDGVDTYACDLLTPTGMSHLKQKQDSIFQSITNTKPNLCSSLTRWNVIQRNCMKSHAQTHFIMMMLSEFALV